MSRTLRETLEAFASELVTSEILMNALSDGGYDAPPERADDLEDFANGALRAEITAVLGGEVADAVVEGIVPVLTMMRRAERDTSVPQSPPRDPVSTTREITPSDTPTVAPLPQPPPAAARALRPVSRPDLPSVPPARAAIPIPPTLLHPRPSKTGKSTPPARAATPAPRPPTHPDSARRTQRERPPTGADLVDLAVVTEDEALAAEVGARFAGRRVVIGPSLAEMPRARVVLLDSRHAFEDLRTTWPAQRAPHVAVLWPADSRERALFEALQPHVPRVVCAGEEAELSDVVMLVTLQLTPP
ncbi:MAG: hypothetical protein J0L92_21900 [Deltaproteobacteria bacterium]|nr:hypothetical protein [Deltaproteobacteria bacterium]